MHFLARVCACVCLGRGTKFRFLVLARQRRSVKQTSLGIALATLEMSGIQRPFEHKILSRQASSWETYVCRVHYLGMHLFVMLTDGGDVRNDVNLSLSMSPHELQRASYQHKTFGHHAATKKSPSY